MQHAEGGRSDHAVLEICYCSWEKKGAEWLLSAADDKIPVFKSAKLERQSRVRGHDDMPSFGAGSVFVPCTVAEMSFATTRNSLGLLRATCTAERDGWCWKGCSEARLERPSLHPQCHTQHRCCALDRLRSPAAPPKRVKADCAYELGHLFHADWTIGKFDRQIVSRGNWHALPKKPQKGTLRHGGPRGGDRHHGL